MKCERADCDRDAVFAAKICVPATGYPADEATALVGIFGVAVCAVHWPPIDLAATFAADLPGLPKGGWKALFLAIARLTGSPVPPDFDRAWLIRLHVDGDEYRGFLRAQESKA